MIFFFFSDQAYTAKTYNPWPSILTSETETTTLYNTYTPFGVIFTNSICLQIRVQFQHTKRSLLIKDTSTQQIITSLPISILPPCFGITFIKICIEFPPAT